MSHSCFLFTQECQPFAKYLFYSKYGERLVYENSMNYMRIENVKIYRMFHNK